MTDLKELTSWIESLPNTQKHKVLEFLDLLRISHQSSLVVGFYVSVTPQREIVFDTQKLSYDSLKKMVL